MCSRITVKTTMQLLCYLDLPQLCLGTLYHPSVTRGDPLTAPKRPETRPKPTDFPTPGPFGWVAYEWLGAG